MPSPDLDGSNPDKNSNTPSGAEASNGGEDQEAFLSRLANQLRAKGVDVEGQTPVEVHETWHRMLQERRGENTAPQDPHTTVIGSSAKPGK